MKWTAVVVVVSVFLVSVAGEPVFPQALTDLAIRPGEAIGPFRLGMTLDQAGGILGRGPDGEGTEGALRVYRWNLTGGSHTGSTAVPILSLGMGSNGTAEVVSTTSTAFTTPAGNSVGLSLNAFKQEFGAAFRGYKDGAGVRQLRFDTTGVAVSYDIRGPGQTTVRAFTVFKPASAMAEPGPVILPGAGVGPVRLGMSAEEAIRAVGRPPQQRRPGGLVWVLEDKDPFGERARLTVLFDNRGAVDIILTDATSHLTAQGSGPGISILELQAEFGAAFTSVPFVIPGQTSFLGIWYDQHGIVGLYHPADPNKRIVLLAVFKKK
ncbi:MAG: hypothetical protein ACRDF5_00655 [bacterium]